MVVLVTTLTTAQEALKQYDGLRAEAAEWARLGLWAGLLSSYVPQTEPHRAQPETCSAKPAGERSQQSYQAALAQTLKSEKDRAHGQDQTSSSGRALLSTLADNHRHASVEAITDAAASAVALLTTARDAELEALGEQISETAESPGALPDERDEHDGVAPTVHTLRTVRIAGLAADPGATDTASRAAVADSEAALRETHAARSQAQKVKAIKKALKAIQIQLDRATRQELSRAETEAASESPYEMVPALDAVESASFIAADLPLAPPPPAAFPAVMTVNAGCAGE